MSPLFNLFIGAAVLLFFIALFWPERGLWFRWKRKRSDTLRILMEDSLKVLYNCEYNEEACDPSRLAGKLGIGEDKVMQVLQILRERNLIEIHNNRILLSKLGRKYALRLIRIHRIWESYLAQETSLKATEWHQQADLREHEMSLPEANELAVRLGNPAFDPHGDPIPTREGALPKKKGIPLRDLPEGKKALIIHLEDEPETIYAQLVAMGLHPGMPIRMLEKNKRSLHFEAEGEELILAPLLSSNVTVLPLDEQQIKKSEQLLCLKEVPTGEEVIISAISQACRGRQRRRLMDLGIVPGNSIRPLYHAPSGDPTAYEVLDTSIALRKEQAQHIFVQPKKAITPDTSNKSNPL